eukprot:SAG31_NODE_2971_length_4839_cov_1.617722_5_plen_72_part_00
MTDFAEEIKVAGESVDIVGTGGDGLVSTSWVVHMHRCFSLLTFVLAAGHVQCFYRLLFHCGRVWAAGVEAW